MDLSSLLHPTPLIPSLRLQPPVSRRQVKLRRRLFIASCTASTATNPSIFGPTKELTGVQPLINGLTPPVRLVSSLAIAAAAIATGYGLGFKIVGTKTAAIAGGAALGVAGGAIVYKMNSEVPEVAAVSLHNLVAGHDDPLELKREEVEAIAKRYGVSKQDEAFRIELADLYFKFIFSILPPGAQELKGNEVEIITKFKSALGIDDTDAANAHLEIGRRIFRLRLEGAELPEQKFAFQKLIYVSNLVFGEASTFLLPWKRLFKVTDAQVNIAIRENAKKLYSIKLNSIGRDIQPNELIELRKFQLLYQLSDDIASEMFREHTRKLIEENIKISLDILKSRSKSATGMPQVIEELEKILSFSDLLTSLKNHPEASQFAPGLGLVSLLGGEYGTDRHSYDLKLIYRAFASESFPNNCLDEKKIDGLNKLRNILGLGKKETEAILLEVKSTMYKKRLSKAFNTDLASAPSKASFLQNLCEDLRFDPQNASKLHEEIYKQKLEQFVADRELSKDEADTLTSYQVRLCIPQETVDKLHSEICGKLFAKVVEKAVSFGVSGFNDVAQSTVRKTAHGLRLSKDEALDITSKAVRKSLIGYIRKAKDASNKIETSKVLKEMISFNSLVVTPLVFDIKGEEPETEIKPDPVSEEEDVDGELKSLTNFEDKEIPFVKKEIQKDINLKDDLTYLEKADLYEAYLHFCMTGNVTKLPLGIHAASQNNDEAEYSRLDQLGEILGLTESETKDIRLKIAEKSFIKEAEVILSDGQLTKPRIEQLSNLQKDVKLPEENARRIINNITRNKMASSIEINVNRGKMGLKEVRELKEANVDVVDIIREELREIIFKKAVEEVFANGKGEFDEFEVFEKVPEDLNIDKEKARKVVVDVAKGRIASTLVQAVSQLRQKNHIGVVESLNDLLACDKAAPAEVALAWAVPAELEELYCIYLKSIPKAEKLSRIQFLLGLSDEKAFALQDAAQEGSLPIETVVAGEEEEEEEEFVF